MPSYVQVSTHCQVTSLTPPWMLRSSQNKLRARLGISTETYCLKMQIVGSTRQMSVALQSFAMIALSKRRLKEDLSI